MEKFTITIETNEKGEKILNLINKHNYNHSMLLSESQYELLKIYGAREKTEDQANK